MKRLFGIILCMCAFLALASCGEKNITYGEAYEIFTDDARQEITLVAKPQRTAVLFSSYAEMVLLSGGSVDISVGESVERGFADEQAPLVDGGAGKSINLELLIESSPDFVIGSFDIAAHREVSQRLNELNIPCALFRVETFDDYDRVMKILCDIYGTWENYYENVTKPKENIEKIISSVPSTDKKKILFIRCASASSATRAKTRENNFVCRMLYELGTVNIAENDKALLGTLSAENIIAENPDYIFFSTMGNENAAKSYMTSVIRGEEWQALDAVQNGSYVFLDKDLFQYKPNNNWDLAYQTLWEILYQ